MTKTKRLYIVASLLAVAGAFYTVRAAAACPSAWQTTWSGQSSCTDGAGRTAYSQGVSPEHNLLTGCDSGDCNAEWKAYAVGANSTGVTKCDVFSTDSGGTNSTACPGNATRHRVYIIQQP